jgi:putative transposase
VLVGDVRLRVREIIRQVCSEMGVTIINGVLSCDHVHMFVEIPPHVSVSDFVRRAKGRSSRKIQQGEHGVMLRVSQTAQPNISASAIGASVSGAGDTSPPHQATSPMTSSCVTSTAIATKTASVPPHDPTGVSRFVIY